MKINWKVRLQSYPFWVAIFGFIGFVVVDSGTMDFGMYEKYVQGILAILIAGGVVADPTTKGYEDSNKAMTYDEPRKDVD